MVKEGVSFDQLIEEFCMSVKEIMTVALISADGLPIASYSKSGIDQDSITAIVASFHSLSETTLKEFNNMRSKEMVINSDGGMLFMSHLQEHELVLYVYTQNTVKSGLILYRVREFTNTLTHSF